MTVGSHEERWLTVSGACRVLGMSRTTLLAAEDADLITPARTPGGHRRYTRAELRRYLVAAGLHPVDARSCEALDPEPVAEGTDECAGMAAADLAAAVRVGLRSLVPALDGDSAGLYLLDGGVLGFCAAFGVPRWLAERLAGSPPPPEVVRALDARCPSPFDPAANAFPEPRSTGYGLAVALRCEDRTLGLLFLLLGRAPAPGELRVVDACCGMLALVVDGRRRIGELERRLERISTLTGR